MAYNLIMIFIETSIFAKEIQRLIPDDNYRMLQTALMLRPDAGSAQDSPANGKGVIIMKTEHFEKLAASIKEAGEIKSGNRKPSRVYEIKPPDIKNVRGKLNVSQNEFAIMIGVSVRTLQNWEQGRRKPEGPAKALLRIASRNPQAVLDALHTE